MEISNSKNKMKKRRIKIIREDKKKVFFQKCLIDWKETINDYKRRLIISKAEFNLNNYPLQIDSLSQLVTIKGIGEEIANRLMNAWNEYCLYSHEHFNKSPTINQIKQLKKGDCVNFIRFNSKARKASDMKKGDNQQNYSLIKPELCKYAFINDAIYYNFSISVPSIKFPSFSINNNDHNKQSHHFHHELHNQQVILLVDNRESIGNDNDKRSIGYHLKNMKINFEYRSLSIGDYIWIIRNNDNTEVICEYIIERKTTNDLIQSIRSSRYKEQKERLSSSEFSHVIYLLEGNRNDDKSIQQALASTSFINGFMVKITRNINETSQFLNILTKRIADKVRTQNVKRMKFDEFQKKYRKNQEIKVKDYWMKMLSVCPRMTNQYLSLIIYKFPSFYLLNNFYKHSSIIDNIPAALNQQLILFFKNSIQ